MVLALASALPVTSTAGDAERCVAAKLRATGQKSVGLLECHARGARRGGARADCVARIHDRFMSTWARIDSRLGCMNASDAVAIEGKVDAFVADVVAALPSTTSTTMTPTSTCPPSTAFYCGQTCVPDVSLCPVGMTCTATGASTCACVGPTIPCGDLAGNFCQWGACPVGMACAADPGSTSCPPSCRCQ